MVRRCSVADDLRIALVVILVKINVVSLVLACGYWESDCTKVGDRYLIGSFMQTGTGSKPALIYEMDTKIYADKTCSSELLFEESYRWEALNYTTTSAYPCTTIIMFCNC